TQRASCITNLPPANVRIASDLGVARRQLGASFKWRLPISNVGGLDSRRVHAELTLPTSLSIIDASVVGGSCVAGGGAAECEPGDIARGDVRMIELELDGSSAGSHIVTAHVTADHDLDRSD